MRKLLIALLSSALLLAACGGDDGPDPAEDPKGALTSAFERFAERDGSTFEITIASDPESLAAMSEGELTEDDAQTILDSSVTVSAFSGENPEDAEIEMNVDIDGHAVELIVVDQTVFARADVRDLVERFGGSQEEVDTAVSQMSGAPGFDFVEPLVEGEWVAFTGAEDLAKQFGAPQPDAQLQEELANDLTAAVEDSAEVTHEGSDDAGDHLVATMEIRSLYDSITEALSSTGQIPGGQLPPVSEIPEEELKLDFWVDGGDLTQFRIDVTQFGSWEGAEMPAGIETLALQIAIEEFGGGVDAPDAAEEVDLQQLIQGALGGMMGGSSSTESSTPLEVTTEADLCASLKDAPQDVIDQFAAECPELQK
ncbi:MAG TPA: hypothetical protein VFS18_05560 [Actinomycetota bacterium]|nr:hypothetical protein [Actinomycetota bacterium]